MDSTQLLLATVLIVTTLFLIIVGVQLFFVLRDVRSTLKRVNTIVDGFEKVGSGMQHGFTEMMGFFGGLKSLFKILDIVHQKKNGRHRQT